MTILDRYLLRLFLAAFAVSTVAFLALFIVVDFASKVTRFFSLTDVPLLAFILEYYLVRIPLFANYTLPVVTLFSAIFALVRMARANELLPVVTAGVSLRRIAAPLLAAGVLVGGANAAIEEWVLPDLAERLGRTDEVLLSQRDSSRMVEYGEEGTLFEINSYDHVAREMREVRITQVTPAGRKRRLIVARGGTWDPQARGWRLREGSVHPFDGEGRPVLVVAPDGRRIVRADPIPAEGMLFQSEVGPEDLQLRSRLTGDFVRLAELKDRAARFPGVPAFRVQIHSRYSFPLATLMLLFLGLPFVSASAAHTYLKGLLFCFAIVFAFYLTHFALLDLAGRGQIPAAAGGWGATAAFGLAGLAMFSRMKT